MTAKGCDGINTPWELQNSRENHRCRHDGCVTRLPEELERVAARARGLFGECLPWEAGWGAQEGPMGKRVVGRRPGRDWRVRGRARRSALMSGTAARRNTRGALRVSEREPSGTRAQQEPWG